MGGRRKTINCTGSGSGSGSRCQSRYGSGAEACICILMPPRTGPQQSQRGKSKQMRLQTVKMAARLGQARAGQGGTLVLGSTCSRGQFDRQQAKCQCPAWPARPGLACGTFPPLSLLDYTLCVPRGFSVLCTFCRLLLCVSVCVCVRGVEFPWVLKCGGNRKRNGSRREMPVSYTVKRIQTFTRSVYL